MKKIILLSLALCLIALPAYLFADRIVLKNGKTITGTVQGQENNLITIITTKGDKQFVKKDEIVSMIYVDSKAVKKKPLKKIQPKTDVAKDAKGDNDVKPANASSDKSQTRNNEKNVERTERTTVDGAITNKVMQKFEDADKRRQETTGSELKALKDELDYLKKEKERMHRLNQGNEDYKRYIDKRMASIEIRVRHIERFLSMDETMTDYFKRKRNPWELVWRSALFPGWGHRYAREEYTGNTYSTTIPILLGFGILFGYIAKDGEASANDALFNGTVVKSIQYSSLGIGSNFSNTFILSAFATYNTNMSAVDSQKELSQTFLNAAIGLYFFQLAHAYFTGAEWSKVQPRDYSNEGLMKSTGFNFKSKADNNNYAKVPERGIRYELEFNTSF